MCAHRYQQWSPPPSLYVPYLVTGQCYLLGDDLQVGKEERTWRRVVCNTEHLSRRPKDHEWFAYCQQGHGAAFAKDNNSLLFGAPGAYYWKGKPKATLCEMSVQFYFSTMNLKLKSRSQQYFSLFLNTLWPTLQLACSSGPKSTGSLMWLKPKYCKSCILPEVLVIFLFYYQLQSKSIYQVFTIFFFLLFLSTKLIAFTWKNKRKKLYFRVIFFLFF